MDGGAAIKKFDIDEQKVEMISRPQSAKGPRTGFTFIEVMVVVAIIGLLSALALTTYINYTRKSAYSEVVAAMAPYQTSVTECYQFTGVFPMTDCADGRNGVPKGFSGKSGGFINSISVSSAGHITAVPNATRGLKSTDTCSLIPNEAGGSRNVNALVWTYRGICVDEGWVGN